MRRYLLHAFDYLHLHDPEHLTEAVDELILSVMGKLKTLGRSLSPSHRSLLRGDHSCT